MEEPQNILPRTMAVIEMGLAERLHVGAQLYVSLHGRAVADWAVGESRPGVPMTPDSMMIWWSSTKAVTAVATAQQWERGKFDLDDPVCRYIPEFGTKGKEAVTIRHVLTHTGGFRFADQAGQGYRGAFLASWEDTIARICAAELEPGWIPGKKAGYHPTSGWFVLGELIRRLDGRAFDQYVREEIFEPLGMRDCWVGMSSERYRAYGDRIGIMHDTVGDEPKPLTIPDSEAAVTHCVPGGGGRGPMREMGFFYEMLLFRGLPRTAVRDQRDGVRCLSPQTLEAITARHRVGMVDQTFQIVVDWGLGFSIDAYAYGQHCSPRTFGHGGARSSICFTDPEYGLVVAVVLNGMPAPERHYERMSMITTSIYEDLGLAEPGSPGRQRTRPALGLT